jgi:hypothetical protein
MTVNELITYLSEYAIDDHGQESDIDFYDMNNEQYMELMPQDDCYYPGIEHNHYGGCGCISGVTLNLRMKR